MSYYMSLGHNSSCVAKRDGRLYGIEQERIDRIKSSSAPPIEAFFNTLQFSQKTQGENLYITHWFDDLHGIRFSKYLNERHYNLFDSLGLCIQTHTENFTHHDAHAMAGNNFFTSHYDFATAPDAAETWHVLVADGFGNQQEVISIYEKATSTHKPVLIDRKYGYNNSLGLLYQYATSFCGMRENQDEYKFLGYESHIDEMLDTPKIDTLKGLIDKYSDLMILSKSYQDMVYASLINFGALSLTRDYFNAMFNDVLDVLDVKARTTFEARTVIGYFIQGVLENVILHIIAKHEMRNVIVSGGIFYNVKLNNRILNAIEGRLCVYPVAGDQGAALGFTDNSITHLNLGERDFYNVDKLSNHAYISPDIELTKQTLVQSICDGKITNLVTQKLEYGPRALGHTSSLFLPLQEIVSYNNAINARNEVMPCAPMIRSDMLDYFFDASEYSRVIGSDRYMVVTYKYKDTVDFDRYSGVMHKIPLTNQFSGRPQVIDKDHHMWDVLGEIATKTGHRAIVNTSFNYHGQPIAYDIATVLTNIKFINNQANALYDPRTYNPPKTIIGRV